MHGNLLAALLLTALSVSCGTSSSGGSSSTTSAELPPIDPALSPRTLGSLVELDTAGTFEVVAYVVSVPDCPPCEGPEPCEPCGAAHLNLILSDGPPPSQPIPTGFHVDPGALPGAAFERGARYRFVVSVETFSDREPYVLLLGAAPAR